MRSVLTEYWALHACLDWSRESDLPSENSFRLSGHGNLRPSTMLALSEARTERWNGSTFDNILSWHAFTWLHPRCMWVIIVVREAKFICWLFFYIQISLAYTSNCDAGASWFFFERWSWLRFMQRWDANKVYVWETPCDMDKESYQKGSKLLQRPRGFCWSIGMKKDQS